MKWLLVCWWSHWQDQSLQDLKSFAVYFSKLTFVDAIVYYKTIYIYIHPHISTDMVSCQNGRSAAPVCPDFTSVVLTWRNRKWKKGRLFWLPSMTKGTKISCFCSAKNWQQNLKRFYTGSLSKRGLGASVEAFPFAEIPEENEYLRLFWSDCSHWRGNLLTVSN